MAKTDPQKDRRTADLAIIHMAAKRMFGDVSRGGHGRDAYEDWLWLHTQKRSASALSEDQRAVLIKQLRSDGALPERARGGSGRTVDGAERPTSAQWAKIGGLARSFGWAGLEDPALKAFCARTAKVASTRFMTRAQASAVIIGMENWLREKLENNENAKG